MQMETNERERTTECSIQRKKTAFVNEPSTAKEETNPSVVRTPTVEVRRPCTKGWDWHARVPRFDLPNRRPTVHSSFDTVGKKTVTMFCKFDLWTIYLGRRIS